QTTANPPHAEPHPPSPPQHQEDVHVRHAPLGPATGAVRPDGTRAPPRAPDLHVLQVLRT
ncbi:hypothetical protein AB0N23_29490, partial [Streptomyces sp. NPDC052644]